LSHRPFQFPLSGLLSGLLAFSLLSACGEPVPPVSSNILLITIDTLRADHLSSYGYARQTSPVLDALAAEGVRFEIPIVQWPKTGPSFASMFTSTYPKDNGIVRKIGTRLPDQFLMVAEALQRQGYSTRAVVANGAVASEFNFHQGFDAYVESWKLTPPEDGVDPTGATMINQLVETVMESQQPGEPFFLWVHYLDPHFPYAAPEPWTDKFANDGLADPEEKVDIDLARPRVQMMGIGSEQVLGGRDELAYYVARYDAEISYVDAKIGDLLEFLGRRGLMDNTLTVVTSDHGESLGEHEYYFDHGRFSYQTCLRVPLIFHQPGVIEPRVDPSPVELLQLAPTLLEAAGIELERGRWMQGLSLWPRLRAIDTPAVGQHYAFSEAGYAVRPLWQRAVTDGRYKLIYAQDWGEQRWIAGKRKPFALFDLQTDPGETENLVGQDSEAEVRLKRVLDQLWSAPPLEVLVDRDAAEEEHEEMDEETRDQLKALGYIQ
jgi:arylsulfatase A-like enzyme